MNIKPRAQKPNRRPAKQVNKALGPRAMLSAEGATFLRVNRSTPSWLTSSRVPHPFGDHPRLSLYARTSGSLVLTRVLGGRVRLVDTGPVLDLCTCQLCAHWDPEARSPSVTSCLHVRTSPEPGLRTPGRSVVGSCSRVLSESSLLGLPGSERFRKQKEHATVALGAAR